MLAPPDAGAWPPEKLFRLLIRRPRPTLPLPPLDALPGVRLFARAMRGTEELDLRDAGQPSRLLDRIAAASVWTASGPLFASPDDVGLLHVADWDRLAEALTAALDVCSPSYPRCHGMAWHETLVVGAQHDTNLLETIALGNATDWMAGGEQPDRYYGLPIADLTDGQLMAYRAARRVVGDRREKK